MLEANAKRADATLVCHYRRDSSMFEVGEPVCALSHEPRHEPCAMATPEGTAAHLEGDRVLYADHGVHPSRSPTLSGHDVTRSDSPRLPRHPGCALCSALHLTSAHYSDLLFPCATAGDGRARQPLLSQAHGMCTVPYHRWPTVCGHRRHLAQQQGRRPRQHRHAAPQRLVLRIRRACLLSPLRQP